MSEEQLIEKLSNYLKDNLGKDLIKALKTALDKLQKENEQLQKRTKASQNFAKIVERDYIDKDEIKQLIGYEENEDISKGEIIAELKTMWEEFNRLENLEDFMATQCISKNKIRTKIKEVAEEPQIYVDTEKFDKEFEKSNYIIEVLKELLGE